MAKESIASMTFFATVTCFIVIVTLIISSLPEALAGTPPSTPRNNAQSLPSPHPGPTRGHLLPGKFFNPYFRITTTTFWKRVLYLFQSYLKKYIFEYENKLFWIVDCSKSLSCQEMMNLSLNHDFNNKNENEFKRGIEIIDGNSYPCLVNSRLSFGI